jgi:hypothetical protein
MNSKRLYNTIMRSFALIPKLSSGIAINEMNIVNSANRSEIYHDFSITCKKTFGGEIKFPD